MSAGEKIREKRKEEGISIEQAQKDTKIRKKYLLAIENDDFSQIPGLVYARAFIKTYSAYLGLDPEETLEEFDRWRQLEDVKTEGLSRKRRTHRTRKSKSSLTKFLSASPKVIGVILVLLVIVSIVAYNYVFLPGESPEEELGNGEVEEMVIPPEEEEEEEEEVNDAEDEENGEESITSDDLEEERDLFTEIIDLEQDELLLDDDIEDTEGITPDAENDIEDTDDIAEDDNDVSSEEQEEEEEEEEIDEIIFRVIASGESWVRVTADGDTIFEGTMDDGDTFEAEPEENLVLRMGNAAAITVEYNDSEEGPFGGSGDVVEEEFTF